MTRDEHLEWCKKRALQYADAGDDMNAFSSMMSDLGKHDELRGHIGIELGMKLMMSGLLKGHDLRNWIAGFN